MGGTELLASLLENLIISCSKVLIVFKKIRNYIAHPEEEKSGLLPIEKEKLIPFIEWAEKLRQQLDDYLTKATRL